MIMDKQFFFILEDNKTLRHIVDNDFYNGPTVLTDNKGFIDNLIDILSGKLCQLLYTFKIKNGDEIILDQVNEGKFQAKLITLDTKCIVFDFENKGKIFIEYYRIVQLNIKNSSTGPTIQLELRENSNSIIDDTLTIIDIKVLKERVGK